MRIVIDMQGAQSKSSGPRGVGRYTLNMAKALIESMPESEIFLALNGKLPTERVMTFFEHVLPRENIKIWNYRPHIPKGCSFEKTEGRPEELFREWFLHQFKADVIWIPNMQEGEREEEVAVSAKLTRGREIVATTLHDINPVLLHKDIIGPQGNRWYKQKLAYTGNCDLIITVSKFSQEKIRNLYKIHSKVRVAYNGYDKKKFHPNEDFLSARRKENFFLYCGGLDPHKNVSRLAEAMSLIRDKKHKLYIVGKNPVGMENGLKEYARSLEVGDRVRLLGFVDDEKLRQLMQRCRAFVMPSYAEGFGLPALEAMACGAPTLVSDATSLKEVVPNAEARFAPESASEVAELMDRVIVDTKFAQSLIDEGLEVAKSFTWERGAESVKEAFASVTPSRGGTTYGLDDLCADLRPFVENNAALAGEIARSIEDSTIFKQEQHIYIDASAVVLEDYLTGIQRVVYGYAGAMADICRDMPDKTVKVIYSSPESPSFYEVIVNEEGRYKRNPQAGEENAIEFYDGDILLMPDLHPGNVIAKTGYLKELSNRGVKIFTVVHDVIASVYGEFFNKDVVREFEAYLAAAANFSGVIGDSNTTLQAYIEWCGKRNISFPPYYVKDYNHLGVDFAKRDHVAGDIPESGRQLLEQIKKIPTVLMVATLEPRKMHKQVLSAMEILWERGSEANLVFVGRQGWKTEKLAERICRHPENGKKLHWLSGISDAYLKAVYEAASGVVVASLAEGYGLPIIEAAHYSKPLLLRDIPVFREVAEDKAAYFEGEDGKSLAEAMEKWLSDIQAGTAKDSKGVKSLSWEESARGILEKMDLDFFAKRKSAGGDAAEEKLRAVISEFDRKTRKASKYQEHIQSLFGGHGEVLDISPETGEAISLLKGRLNLGGIHCRLRTGKLSIKDILRLCKEAYYRLEGGAVLALAMKENDDALAAWETPSPVAEDLTKIMEAIGFEASTWRDEENGICVVSGKKE